MPFIFKDQHTIKTAIEKFKKEQFGLDMLSPECLLDFVGGKFTFVSGTNCETNTPPELIGSGITKGAIREMRKRFEAATPGDDKIVCIDYGVGILNALMSAETKAIRFYFGLRDRDGDGNNVMSLILVGLDKDNNELVRADLKDADEAGKEVGHGTKRKDAMADDKFRVLKF